MTALRLADALEGTSRRKFATQVAISDGLSQIAQSFRMNQSEVLDGLITALVSVVQSRAPAEEWSDVGVILADVIQRRLTVTGVT